MIMSGATALFTVWEEMGPGIELGPSKNLHLKFKSNWFPEIVAIMLK